MSIKLKKFLKIFIICCLILLLLVGFLVLNLFGIMHYMRKLSEPNLYYDRGFESVPNADYIVVPGAQIGHELPGMKLEHRLNYAYKLYKANKAPKIILSGGFDEEVGRYEIEVMYSYLVRRGIPAEDIVSDINGDNTYATLKRVKEYVGDKSVIFCTQELYSFRALYIAKQLDLNMVVFVSDAVIYVSILKDVVREHLAQVKAILNCTLFVPDVLSITESPYLK